MKVLEEIKDKFLEAAKFIDDCLGQEYSKGNLTVEDVVFFAHA